MNEKPTNIAERKCEATDLACLQSYQITMGKEDFTATELRILSCIMLKLKDRQIAIYDGKPVRVSDKDRQVVIDNALITVGTNYSHVKDELKRLRKKTIVIESKGGFKGFGLIDEFIYKNGGEQIVIDVGKTAYPELVTLGKSYTKYSLEFLFKTQSAYAIRWYMLGCHWANKGQFYIAISTIREMFVIGENEHQDMCNFKKFVIKKPLTIVNRESDIEIKLDEQHKQGREIVGLSFIVSTKSREPIGGSEPAIDSYKKDKKVKTMNMTPKKKCAHLEAAMNEAILVLQDDDQNYIKAKAKAHELRVETYHLFCEWKSSVHEENEKKKVTTNSKLLLKRFWNYLNFRINA